MSVVVTAGANSLPLCSYPAYPHYMSGDAAVAGSMRADKWRRNSIPEV
jgi:hypothetical protein